ncbi:MAG: hypothetical protein OXG64_06280 [Chloroflexi bacterium]|nr:hypothetical protein [Chloroflexota bacterium]
MIGVLTGFVLQLPRGITCRDIVGMGEDFIAGFRNDGLSAMDIAVGLDFNHRSVGQRGMVSYT